MIAQKEIAKALGVSAVTVSRALRNHPDLARETRQRILEKARELGYPVSTGSTERKGVKRLGVLLYEKDPEKDHGQVWRSDAEPPRRILAGLHREAGRSGIETILEMPPSDDVVPLMIQNRAVDGVIVMGRYHAKALENLRQIPAIAVSSFIASDWMPRIVMDNFHGMHDVTEHLISLGHKKILFLGAEAGGWTEIHREREKGYLVSMFGHGLAPAVLRCPGYDPRPLGDQLLGYTAIACSCDELVFLLQDHFRERGMVLPRDCSLAGFDGTHRSEERGVTTHSPNWALMGRMAFDFLIRRPDSLPGSGVEIVVPGQLMVRESSGPAPASA